MRVSGELQLILIAFFYVCGNPKLGNAPHLAITESFIGTGFLDLYASGT